MGKIKVSRDDVLRRAEINDMLSQSPDWVRCVIALLWAFGKRVHEVLRVKKEDIWIDQDFMYVRFHVGKKRKFQNLPFVKRISLKHPAVPYVLEYAKTIEKGYLFPADVEAKEIESFNKKYNRTYTVHREAGHIYRQRFAYYLKKINPNSYPHLFRHSLATEMSERGVTVQQLMAWFDWDNPAAAMVYVQRSPTLTKELSERTW